MKSRLKDEIKKRDPFESLEQEVFLNLMRTADVLARDIEEQFKPIDLSATQYNVLRILRGAGPKGLPTLEIAQRMIEQTPGITRLIDHLETKTLVLRERCPTDRRQVFCRISKEGLALLARLDKPVQQAEEVALAGLSPRQLTQLVTLLDRARKGIQQEAS